MSRLLFAGAALLGLCLLAVLATSPALFEPGEHDCPTVDGQNPGEPTYHEHDGEMGSDTAGTDCPVDDAAGMGTVPSR